MKRKGEPFFCPLMSASELVEVENGKKVPFKAGGAVCARWVKGTCRDCEVAESKQAQDIYERKDK